MKNKDQVLLESLYDKVIQEQMDDIGDEQLESEYELRTDIGDEESTMKDIEDKLGVEEEEEDTEEEEGEEKVEDEEETALEKEAEEELPKDAPEEGLSSDQTELFSQLIKKED